jgi:hypothetical protein
MNKKKLKKEIRIRGEKQKEKIKRLFKKGKNEKS